MLSTTEILSNVCDHASSVSEIHPGVGETTSAISCHVEDTPTDIAHPHPRLAPPEILVGESDLPCLQSLDPRVAIVFVIVILAMVHVTRDVEVVLVDAGLHLEVLVIQTLAVRHG